MRGNSLHNQIGESEIFDGGPYRFEQSYIVFLRSTKDTTANQIGEFTENVLSIDDSSLYRVEEIASFAH